MKLFLKIANIIILVLLIFSLGYFVGKKYDVAIDENDDLVGISYSANEQKIRRLMSLIDNQYVEEVDTDSLVDDAIRNILGKLDPHSAYLEQEEASQIEEEIKGEFVGIGIQFRTYKDTLVITRVLAESPNKNILKAGDRIVSANRVNLTKNNTEKAADVLRGDANSKIEIELLRDGKPETFQITRKAIPVKSVIAGHMLTDKIGFIKLIRFGDKSAQEVKSAILSLKQKGMQTLIFDLRSNPGGTMQAAEEISDEFLKSQELIVYTQDKAKKRDYKYATSKGNFEDNKIYILIDEGSASASEIVAGAVQEWGRGMIVGRRSFGKGLVQKEISLGDGSRLRLTTARYYTPSGRSIQKPYTNGNEDDYNDDLLNRYTNGELTNADSIKINKELKFTTPTGKTVYGGGGIVPDIFIPIDTLQLTTWFYASGGNNRIANFVFEAIDKDKANPIFQNENTFLEQYESLGLLNQFLKEIQVKKVNLAKDEQTQLNLYIKALAARQLFGENGFYKVWNQLDNAVLKILELENQSL